MCFLGGKHSSLVVQSTLTQLLLLVLAVNVFFQEKVACLADNDARLALDPNDKYQIQVANFDRISLTLGFQIYATRLLLLIFLSFRRPFLLSVL